MALETNLSTKSDAQNQVEFHAVRNAHNQDQNAVEQSAEKFGFSHFRLVNEIEEEEKAFARATTKFAIDAAKEETEKAMQRASTIGTLCADLNDRLNRYVSALCNRFSSLDIYSAVSSQFR